MTGTLIGIARKSKLRAPLEEMDAIGVSVELGIDGDKRGKMKKRQISIHTKEDWDAALAELGPDVNLPWTTRRANLFVEGIKLPQKIGTKLKVGSVLLEITGENDPCDVMNMAHNGLRSALEPDWRGGVLCRVLEPGQIKIGDMLSIKAES